MENLCIPMMLWVYDHDNRRCERLCFRVQAFWYWHVFWDKISCQVLCENNDKKLQRIRWK